MRLSSCFLAAACVLGWGQAQADGLSGAEVSAAKKIYTSKCARCHKFYEPAKYDEAAWRFWMGKMRKKARLGTNDYELLLRYTEGLRSAEKGVATHGGTKGSAAAVNQGETVKAAELLRSPADLTRKRAVFPRP